jgi:hypothetical protein
VSYGMPIKVADAGVGLERAGLDARVGD